ncbi:hypothetical protein L484_021357 [Morus notabilis]|uniref:Uncharacterized protein n=1 Tax=Morus notabilis TaxID=981085 RepID=W9RHC1_9ROSA|nr:hypothetical protein L484_021357 [Morus notabilis]
MARSRASSSSSSPATMAAAVVLLCHDIEASNLRTSYPWRNIYRGREERNIGMRGRERGERNRQDVEADTLKSKTRAKLQISSSNLETISMAAPSCVEKRSSTGGVARRQEGKKLTDPIMTPLIPS